MEMPSSTYVRECLARESHNRDFIEKRLTQIAIQAANVAQTIIGNATDLDKLVALRNEIEEAIDQIERQLEREK